MRRSMLLIFFLAVFAFPFETAQAVRPGETPPPQSLELRMNAGFVFPSALSTCKAGIENPASSGLWLRYALTIEAEELFEKTGVKSVVSEPVLLYEGGPIAPGERIEGFRLGALPGGMELPEGMYDAVMTVSPEDHLGRPSLQGEFAVQVFIHVMISQTKAGADPEGKLDLAIYNGKENPARYALAIRTKDLSQPYGLDADLTGEYMFSIVALSDRLSPGRRGGLRLHALSDGMVLKAGVCEAWLLRMGEGDQAPYASARVLLSVPDAMNSLPQAPAFPDEMLSGAEQAVINAEYLLKKP